MDFLVSWNFLRVGIDLPVIEVEVHVGGRALPSFFNFIINILEVTICKTYNIR